MKELSKELSVEDLAAKTGNIYEAVVVMARRARQVTDEQKTIIDRDREVVPSVENKENEDFDEVEIDHEALMKNHVKFPKPARVAIEEMAAGGVQWETKTPETQG
jgi:DNA-directed RNA polymerase omega subunit